MLPFHRKNVEKIQKNLDKFIEIAYKARKIINFILTWLSGCALSTTIILLFYLDFKENIKGCGLLASFLLGLCTIITVIWIIDFYKLYKGD